jgi:toxin ParE1/3/4
VKRLKLVISDEAIADLIDLWTYISEDSLERADRFVDQIHEKCEILAGTPMMGRERSELLAGMRSFPVGRYLIFYRIVEETLQVVRVLSGYRDLDALF